MCSKCGHRFCFTCMGSHHVVHCGAWVGVEEAELSDARACAKSELERYLHYYQRYHGHGQAQEFVRTQLKRRKEEELELVDDTWIDPKYLIDADTQLLECRRVLKHTYVLAYYCFVDNATKKQREQFEFH